MQEWIRARRITVRTYVGVGLHEARVAFHVIALTLSPHSATPARFRLRHSQALAPQAKVLECERDTHIVQSFVNHGKNVAGEQDFTIRSEPICPTDPVAPSAAGGSALFICRPRGGPLLSPLRRVPADKRPSVNIT